MIFWLFFVKFISKFWKVCYNNNVIIFVKNPPKINLLIIRNEVEKNWIGGIYVKFRRNDFNRIKNIGQRT